MTNQNDDQLIKNIFDNVDILKNYSGVEWKTQNSRENDILFYNLPNQSDKSVSVFKKRISKAKFKICLLNSDIEFEDERIINSSSDDIYAIKEALLNLFYPLKKELYFIGVTGTNGKTTTVDLIRQMAIKKNIGVMTFGTLGVFVNSVKVNNHSLTTPDYIDLRKDIFKQQGSVEVVAMELSSIALVQKRSGGIKFDKIGWTNFTQDHLDDHGSMDNYFKAKMIVYSRLSQTGNIYFPMEQIQLLEKIKHDKSKYVIKCPYLKNPFFKIQHNKENLSLAIELINEKAKLNSNELESLTAPDGRANIIEYKNNFIVVDYAHTPDGVLSITSSLKESFPEKMLITLFGCGGDRDKTKRALMAQAAEKNSDSVILTSDNPRFEDPVLIIKDAQKGFEKEQMIIIDRREAIKYAINNLDDSVLLVAGKGHEDYLDIQGVKEPYNDHDWIMENIND